MGYFAFCRWILGASRLARSDLRLENSVKILVKVTSTFRSDSAPYFLDIKNFHRFPQLEFAHFRH